MTTIDIVVFIILTLLFTSIELFVKWEIKLIEILKTISVSTLFSVIIITIWNLL